MAAITSFPADLKSLAEKNEEEAQKLLVKALMYVLEPADKTKTPSTDEAVGFICDALQRSPHLEDVAVDALWMCTSIKTSIVANNVNGAPVNLEAIGKIVSSLMQHSAQKGEAAGNELHTKLQLNLLPKLLETSGLATEQDFFKRLRVYNTHTLYKQHKYNLLHEESEGYAKIVQLLSSLPVADADRSDMIVQKIAELAGTFELDPNRIMDLIIDVIESRLYKTGKDGQTDVNAILSSKPTVDEDTATLLTCLRAFSIDKLPSLLSFRISSIPISEGNASNTLLATTCFLASENILNIKILCDKYLPPVITSIKGVYDVFWKKEKRRILALSKVSLSGGSKEDTVLREMEQKLQIEMKSLESNNTIRMLLVLLHWQEWDAVKDLLPKEYWGKLASLMPLQFGEALCGIAHHRIEPLYHKHVTTPSLRSDESNGDEDKMETSNENSGDDKIENVLGIFAEPLMYTLSSCCIRLHPILFVKVCRLIKALLGKQNSDSASMSLGENTLNFLKTFLVPSLSLFECNPAMSTEIWNVLTQLDYATRYSFYTAWRGIGLEKAGLMSSPSGKPLPLVESELMSGKAARYTLKRLSTDNVRAMSRQMSKVAHSNPLVLFTLILNQIESYDNLVDVIVEGMQYVNLLGLDVLGYCILSRLSGLGGVMNRSKLKEDGVNVSQWLQSLESFCGAFYERNPFVEFRGLLSYLMRRLQEGSVLELGILKVLLKKPGGYAFVDYSPAESLSISQLEGRGGSMILQQETMSFGVVENVSKTAVARIKEVLQADGNGVLMLILVAQARSKLLFEKDKQPLKLLGNLYDTCQVVMSILLECITDTTDRGRSSDPASSGTLYKCTETMPPLTELCSKYGFDLITSWMLCRPLIKAASAGDTQNVDLERFAFTEDSRIAYKATLPDAVWASVSADLVERFLTSSLYDVCCPEKVYENEISRLEKDIERHQKASGGNSGPKSDPPEIERAKFISSALHADVEKQKKHTVAFKKSLSESKDALFCSKAVSQDAFDPFFAHCIFPRSLQSPADAMYCAHFMILLHEVETPGFSVLHCINAVVNAISGALFGLTEAEGANLAIFVMETWKYVKEWRHDEHKFKAEVEGKPGAVISTTSESGDQAVSYQQFIALYNHWHYTLGDALIKGLESSEYMHMRASLLVLTRIVNVFPTRSKFANRLVEALAPFEEQSARQDVKTSAIAYKMMLLKAGDDGVWNRVKPDKPADPMDLDNDKGSSNSNGEKAEPSKESSVRFTSKSKTSGATDPDKSDSKVTSSGSRDLNFQRRAEDKNQNRGVTSNKASNNEAGEVRNGGRHERGYSRSPSPRGRDRPRSFGRSSGDRERDRDRDRRRESKDSRPTSEKEREVSGNGSLVARSDGNSKSSRKGRGSDGDGKGYSGGRGSKSGSDDGKGLGTRWSSNDDKRDDGKLRGGKRSRPPSPAPDLGRHEPSNHEGRNSKRQRTTRGSSERNSREASPANRLSPPPSSRPPSRSSRSSTRRK